MEFPIDELKDAEVPSDLLMELELTLNNTVLIRGNTGFNLKGHFIL